MTSPSSDECLQQLLRPSSIEEVEQLADSSLPLTEALKKHRHVILRKHISPEAWSDAIACVDRRIHSSKKARAAFDADYESCNVASIENQEHWDLRDLWDLVKIIDKLILHIGDVGSVDTPGIEYVSLRAWEAAWELRCNPVDANRRHPLGDLRWLEEDGGTENPTNFQIAFSRHTKLTHKNLSHEGIAMDEITRAKLQRAFFRLEFIRRAYYSRPLFPKGAKWQNRDSTFVNGEPQSLAGETPETRLARAEQIFKGWTKDDFVEIICAFKATLNFYAVPVGDMIQDFVDGAYAALDNWDLCHALDFNAGEVHEIRANADAVSLQWELDPLKKEPDFPLWGIKPDREFLELEGQLRDNLLQLELYKLRRFVQFSHGEFDDLGCTIFKAEEVRRANYPKKMSKHQKPLLHETHPEREMSKFFHALCSLPLKFLDRFIDMSTKRKRRFLKTTYFAVSRIKASHAPMFLSGEVRAWSSKPADERGPRHWEHQTERRVFPELAVRYVALGCLSKLYTIDHDSYFGWRLRMNRLNRYVWRWDEQVLTPLAWSELRSKIAYKPFNINTVFRMSERSWQGLWRSDRRCERLTWVGRSMNRFCWEGYGHPGRLDPNECYCHVGEGCGLCTHLPPSKIPEWELFTEDDWKEEFETEKQLLGLADPWASEPNELDNYSFESNLS
ncbi:uncharacterized protein CTRU02_201504 [Colletotrichum truncatum]|uniref:Uncharacterized protein n=1 Tax=Colletotrichum truncatum TaxID=5467 RepID=A0ACC3ZHJ7_COLTU|nr:uncharacterized protein CTRU02_14375 [Colletotrichum truncatum]KAF6782336.1 hypothetical protein CTRU02_14375 [Colletotrichum truncatum]